MLAFTNHFIVRWWLVLRSPIYSEGMQHRIPIVVNMGRRVRLSIHIVTISRAKDILKVDQRRWECPSSGDLSGVIEELGEATRSHWQTDRIKLNFRLFPLITVLNLFISLYIHSWFSEVLFYSYSALTKPFY